MPAKTRRKVITTRWHKYRIIEIRHSVLEVIRESGEVSGGKITLDEL